LVGFYPIVGGIGNGELESSPYACGGQQFAA